MLSQRYKYYYVIGSSSHIERLRIFCLTATSRSIVVGTTLLATAGDGSGAMSDLTEAEKESLRELAEGDEPFSDVVAAYLHAIEETE